MAKIKKIQRIENSWIYHFICPGCNEEHAFNDVVWKFNYDFNSPSISPSYLITYDHASEENNKKCKEFYLKNNRYPTREELPYDLHDVCHSFIENGMIRYLGDCTHQLKNQTVELPGTIYHFTPFRISLFLFSKVKKLRRLYYLFNLNK